VKGPCAFLAVTLLAFAGPLTASTAQERATAQEAIPGVANAAQARIDYMLKCQGCHQPDGSGNMANTPPLKDEVARFLHVEGGREFLGRVPGVASTDLADDRLAQLLNWTIYRFDAGNVPRGFKPYAAREIAQLRHAPLRLERAETRARLVSLMNQ